MKFYYNKYLYLFLIIFVLQNLKAQYVFFEDFGRTTTRTSSQYVPQGGADDLLGEFTFNCTSFYYPATTLFTAANKPSCVTLTNANTYVRNISDGYYTVIDPTYLRTSLGTTGAWWRTVPDHTSGDIEGAVLVVNAGIIKNQYYRRAVQLQPNKTYRFSYWVMSNSTSVTADLNYNSLMEVQNISTEAIIKTSPELKISAHNVWEQKVWTFKTPASAACTTNYAMSIRNNFTTSNNGNDFYIDDISLEEVIDSNAEEIPCVQQITTFDEIIKSNEDNFMINYANGGSFNVIENDRVQSTSNVVLSGTGKNATISRVGNWPSGYILDTNGNLIVSANATPLTTPLEYQICNLIGVCSTAKIRLYKSGTDLSVTSAVTNQCNYNGINATGNTNQYTLTIKNNLPFPVTTSENTKVEVKFNVKNGALINDSKLLAFTSTGDNAKWDTPIETYNSSISNDYTFKLKTGQTIPANGSITLVFSKNWNLVDLVFGTTERLGENDINSLDIKLNVLNSSNQNIDDNTLDNTAFISVFRTSNINAQSITKTVGQGEVITVGEVANLGDHTNGFKFYYNNAEISSSYLVPTSTRTPFVFQYESACNSAKATVTAQVGFDSPGRITLDQNINLTQRTLIENIKLCPGSSIKINTMELPTYFYSWEFSKDGGITWITSSEMGIEESDTAYNLELESLSESLKVRRISKRILDGNTAYSNEVTIIVQDDIKFNFPNNINSFAIRKGDVFTLPTITTNLNTTITIKNDQGQIVSSSIPFNNAGEYYFTVNAKTTSANNQLENCEASTTFKVVVYDLEDCGVNYKKVFATHYKTWTSGIGWTDDADRAVNGNRANSAKINSVVNVAGLGTVGIDLYFTKPDGVTLYTPNELKGKKVTLKLGEQYSGLKIAGGLSVVGRITTASSNNIGLVNGIPAGTENYNSGFSTAVKGGLLDALKGDNVFQFSFVPGDINGVPVPYNGVRIQLGSLLGVADLANVFYAYIEEEVATDVSQDIIRVDPPQSLNYPTSQNDINGTYITGIDNDDFLLNPFVDDVSWGNRTEVVNVASSLSSVVFPYYAVDNDVNSYALFNSIVGVLNQQFLKTHLRKPARPGDQVQITISYPEISVVNLSLLQLGNFRIVFYLGDTEVGNIPLEEFRILDLGLFRLKFGEVQRTILSKQINVPFDSFEIRQFNTVTVNLGEGLRVHDVRVGPMMLFEGQEDPTATTIICASELLGIQDPSICNSYDVALVEILEFGDTFVDKDGNPILDKDGSPVKSIKTIGNVITNLTPVNVSGNSLVSYYRFDQLYKEYEKEGILLIRVQAKRDGVNYGDPEYLKIKLRNCNDAIVNPVIKINAGK